MLIIYKLFGTIVYFLAPYYLKFRVKKKKEHPLRYKEKLSLINKSKPDGFLIWFHVASVGEGISILPLIEKLQNEQKIKTILVTSITLSSAEVLVKKLSQNKKAIHQFLPLDSPKLVKKFLEYWSPNLSIFVDSEIWPNFIFEIKKKKIPLLLINGRISKKTFSRWKIIKNISKKIFEKFDLCLAADNSSKNKLEFLGIKNVKNFGNLKFISSNSIFKSNQNLLNLTKNRKIWCASSTHDTEEIFCAKTHFKLKKHLENILTIIIPRHVDRIKNIYKELSKMNLQITLSSKIENYNLNTDVILVDSYGEVGKFYHISKSVFLGKSLINSIKDDSGQNPIEAARLGCKVLHGPNVSNFSEIYDFLKSLNFATQVESPEELSRFLLEEFNNESTNIEENIKKIEVYGHEILNNVIREIKSFV